jgi:predicted GNAT family N-acyltransferase
MISVVCEFARKDDAFEVRRRVFVGEQGFVDEFDSIDDTAVHVTSYVDGVLCGCARLFPNPDIATDFIFGRLAVLPEFRHQGIGGFLLDASEDKVRELGGVRFDLHAQYYVVPFYEAHGYRAYGEVGLDEGVEHIWMTKDLV